MGVLPTLTTDLLDFTFVLLQTFLIIHDFVYYYRVQSSSTVHRECRRKVERKIGKKDVDGMVKFLANTILWLKNLHKNVKLTYLYISAES